MTDKTNRRDFLKATGAAAAVAGAGLPIRPAQAKEKAGVSAHKPLTKVNCFSEDGELKEVIFGTMEEFRLPAYNPEEVVTPLEAERLRKEVDSLRPRIKVHAFPYYEVGKIGGSLRCNTCPIYREG